MDYSLEKLQTAYQSSLKGGNLLNFIDFKVGTKIQSLRFGDIETIVKIDYYTGAFRTEQRYYKSFEYGIEWKFYLPESDDTTQLEQSDYQSLLELAVELNDKAWFDEICATINELKVSEQHA